MSSSINRGPTKAPKHFYQESVDEVKVEVMSARGNMYGFWIENNSASAIFVQMFNKLAVDVTVGITTPDFTYKVYGTASIGKDAHDIPLDNFDTGLTIAITAGRTDANAPASPATVNIWHSNK